MSIKTELSKALRLADTATTSMASFAIDHADALMSPKGEDFLAICETIAEHYGCEVKEGQRGYTFEGDPDRAQCARVRLSELRAFVKRGGAARVRPSTDPVEKAIKTLDGLTTAQLKKVLAHFRNM